MSSFHKENLKSSLCQHNKKNMLIQNKILQIIKVNKKQTNNKQPRSILDIDNKKSKVNPEL